MNEHSFDAFSLKIKESGKKMRRSATRTELLAVKNCSMRRLENLSYRLDVVTRACHMAMCACVLLLLAQYTKQMKRARVKGIVDFAKYIIKMLFFDFIQLIGNKDHLLEFLIQHGVIPSTINCEKCDEILFLDKETLLSEKIS